MTTKLIIDIESALSRRDLRSVCWHVIGELLFIKDGAAKYAGPMAAMMRVLRTLGEESPERAEMLMETAVIGSALHGLPPRTPEQWKIAERLYDPATLEDFRRWKPEHGWFGHGGTKVDFDPDWNSGRDEDSYWEDDAENAGEDVPGE